MPLLKKGKKRRKKTKKKKPTKPKVLQPHEMPDILKMFTIQKFLKIKFINEFEKSRVITFSKDFSELDTVLHIKEFLEQKIYQKASKIKVFIQENQQKFELEDSMKIKAIPNQKHGNIELIFNYELPPSFIRNKL
jgi:hypothetical protein